MVASMVLETLIKHGATLAMPGEFSKRAFLNGRMDLSQAQAVSDLIEAKSEDAVRILARQMEGSLGVFVEEARDNLLKIIAHVEVSIDYADDDLPDDLLFKINKNLDNLETKLTKITESSKQRKGLIHGFRIAIIGKPNVGKSSLLNALLKSERAIISDIAGTTRDTIEEELRIGTHLVKIIDTAGIRLSEDKIEQIGISRSRQAAKDADIIIALFDASADADEQDVEILSLVEEFSEKKTCFYVLNKADLPQVFKIDYLSNKSIKLSANIDVSPLIKALSIHLDSQEIGSDVLLTSHYQIDKVSTALEAIKEAKTLLDEGSLELFAFHLQEAVHAFGAITRPYGADEVLDKMFGDFCLGK